MTKWNVVVEALDKKIRVAMFWMVFWAVSVGFWLWNVVTDPDWLSYAMLPITAVMLLVTQRDLSRQRNLRRTARAMARYSPHRH